MGEGFLAVGYFARVATGHSVLITAIDDVTDNEVGGNDADVDKDVGCDGPNTGLKLTFAIDVFGVNIAVPGLETEKITAFGVSWLAIGYGKSRDGCNNKSERQKKFLNHIFILA